MSVALKSTLKIAFLFFVGVAILYFAFKGQDLEKIEQEIKVANLFWVGVSVAMAIIANVLRALRWQMLYKSINYKVGFFSALFALYVGYLSNLAIPRFGELVRCKALQRQASIPFFASIGTVITERLFDLLVLFLALSAMLIFQYDVVASFLKATIVDGLLQKFSVRYLYWLIAGLVVLLLLAFLLLNFLLRRFKLKFLRIYSGLKQGLSTYQKLKSKTLFLIYSILIWGFYFLATYVAFFALKSTSYLGLDTAFTTLNFSSLAMATPVQGGIGVFHWMTAKCLLLYNVAFTDGLAYATILYAVQLLPIILFGTIGFFILFKKKRLHKDKIR